MTKPRIIFFGTPEFPVSILKALLDHDYNVVAIVSQPDRPVGRKRQIVPTPIHQVAIDYNIPCVQPENLIQEKEEILAYEPDLIITCAYGQFIPSSILNAPKYGCLNIHPSLLPKYRGGAPMHHAIIAGESETGVSLMEMIKQMDAGRIYAQVKLPIGPDETTAELSERLNQASVKLLLDNLPLYLNGELEGIEQDESAVTIGYNISREEEQVSFAEENLTQLYNHIRGLIDWPLAYGMLDGKRMKFLKVRKEEKEMTEVPGTVLGFENHAMLIACTGGVLKVYELQPEGKKKMDADAFKNGNGKEVIGKVFA